MQFMPLTVVLTLRLLPRGMGGAADATPASHPHTGCHMSVLMRTVRRARAFNRRTTHSQLERNERKQDTTPHTSRHYATHIIGHAAGAAGKRT